MKVATKHDIEAILNWCKKYEKEAREKHKNKLINDEENVWSSFYFGYAEGINFVLDYLEKIIWSENELKSEQNKVAVEKLEELQTYLKNLKNSYKELNDFENGYRLACDDFKFFLENKIKELKGKSDE